MGSPPLAGLAPLEEEVPEAVLIATAAGPAGSWAREGADAAWRKGGREERGRYLPTVSLP